MASTPLLDPLGRHPLSIRGRLSTSTSSPARLAVLSPETSLHHAGLPPRIHCSVRIPPSVTRPSIHRHIYGQYRFLPQPTRTRHLRCQPLHLTCPPTRPQTPCCDKCGRRGSNNRSLRRPLLLGPRRVLPRRSRHPWWHRDTSETNSAYDTGLLRNSSGRKHSREHQRIGMAFASLVLRLTAHAVSCRTLALSSPDH